MSKIQFARIALDLGAADVGGPLSRLERSLCERAENIPVPGSVDLHALQDAVAVGRDPLGEAWVQTLPRSRRQTFGVVYTPHAIVRTMVAWVACLRPARVIDMGSGSGRFTAEAARQCPDATLVAIDLDPVATLLTRARLAVLGHRKARVMQGDYLDVVVDRIRGKTAFVGNPPYVRHHALTRLQKAKAAGLARGLGYDVSGLAGLHVHFLFATFAKAAPGDIGCVITSAEWMQVRYGEPLRDLLLDGAGLEIVHVLDPNASAFPEIMTTAAILGFRVGSRRRSISVTAHSNPDTFGSASGPCRQIDRSALKGVRWRFLLPGGAPLKAEKGTAPHQRLGDYCRVHRGVATGANYFFVMTREEAERRDLIPWVLPVLTGAEEVIQSEGVARPRPNTRVMLCPPADVDLTRPSSRPLRKYLRLGSRLGVPAAYLCAHRRTWWYLGRPIAPPIVATYMARRPPAFALNPDGLLILNVLHGLYPVNPMDETTITALVKYLNSADLQGGGRIYQGGLEKFEPRELEAVPLPPLAVLMNSIR